METAGVILFLLALGIVAAVFGSIAGLGGGGVTVPVLMLIGPRMLGGPVSTQTAVGTSLAVLIFTALSATLTYHKQGKVDVRSGKRCDAKTRWIMNRYEGWIWKITGPTT